MEDRLAGLALLDTFSSCQFLSEHAHNLGEWVLGGNVQRDERCTISKAGKDVLDYYGVFKFNLGITAAVTLSFWHRLRDSRLQARVFGA